MKSHVLRGAALLAALLLGDILRSPDCAGQADSMAVQQAIRHQASVRAGLWDTPPRDFEFAVRKAPLGCANGWRRTSFWEVRGGGTDGIAPNVAVVDGRVFFVRGVRGPEITPFVAALLRVGTRDGTTPSTACIVSTLAFALSSVDEGYCDAPGHCVNSDPASLATSLREAVVEPWPREGVRWVDNGVIGTITIFQLEPHAWEFVPVRYVFLLDTDGRVKAWGTRDGIALPSPIRPRTGFPRDDPQ